MAAVTVVMSGDEAALFRAQQRILDQQLKLASGYKGTSKEAQEAAKKAKEEADARNKAEREHLKMMERGKAMTESLRSPQEAYNAAVRDANELHEKGAIDAETLARKLNQLKTRLEEQTGVSSRNAAVERARLDVMQKNGRVTDQAAAAINRYEAELVELDRKQEAGTMSAQELARAQAKVRSEFDKSVGLADKQNSLVGLASSQLGQYATAAGAVALAVRAITAAWETVVEEQQKGLDALKATEDTGRALLQISDSPEQFASMRAEAQALASQEGVDVATVERVMFSAVSEGFRDALPEIIAANQVIAPEAAAGVAGQVPALFQGAIGAMEAVDLTLKSARDSRLSFEQIARALPAAAEGGSIAQATPEETLATLSVLASRFKSGETAADRIKAFSTLVGLDQGTTGTTDQEFGEKLAQEQERAANAAKQLRAKEERVADLEKQFAEASTSSSRDRIQINLDRARRDVSEFDRSKLDVVTPEREQARESLAGMGIIKAVEALQAMTQEERTKILGTDQEKNAAFLALSQELGTIKAREQEIIKEREAFAQGGGILRERMDIAAGDEQLSALKENARETARLEHAYRTGRGIEGAAADSAVKATETALMQGTFGGRVANTLGIGSIPARGAVAVGADAGSASVLGAGASELVGGGGAAGILQAMTAAAAAMNRSAAAQEKAAAGRQQRPATDAARLQAGLANQGG